MTDRHSDNLAAALSAAVRTAQAADVQNARAIERLGPARVAFLRSLAGALEPALEVLVDRGSDATPIDARAGLWIDRRGGFFLGSAFPDHAPELSEAELAELRIEPERIVLDLVARLETHSSGLERSSERLDRLRRRLESIAALLQA